MRAGARAFRIGQVVTLSLDEQPAETGEIVAVSFGWSSWAGAELTTYTLRDVLGVRYRLTIDELYSAIDAAHVAAGRAMGAAS